MKTIRPLLLLLLLALAACKGHGPGIDAATNSPAAATNRYQLTGQVIMVIPDNHALLIKHEAIVGLMEAMTMQYAVDDAVLKAATKDARITATVVSENGSLRLEDVKFTPAPAP